MAQVGLVCPKCGTNAPATESAVSLVCPQCGTPLDPDATIAIDPDATRAMETVPRSGSGGGGWSKSGSGNVVVRMGMLQPGSLLADRYEILQLLGEGGMGAVYKARDREVDRPVALKVIRPELAGETSILHRFKQELLLARKVTHRNVIRIFDLGLADGLRFITMEFVEGRDLASLLEERKFSPTEAVAIVQQICAALETAHSEGVIHRDLKPQNILVEPGGRVCVMDFGLAKSLVVTGVTQAGAVLGTPAYMSPEQAKGEIADTRSDLFAVGIIFYQMLTGTVPFKAETAMATMLLRTQGPPPPPITLDPQIPQALNDVVMKALMVKRDERYQSATEILRDLQVWQGAADARLASSAGSKPARTIAATAKEAERNRSAPSIITPAIKMMSDSGVRKWIALSVIAVALVVGTAFGVYSYFTRPSGPVAPMTVIIADFNNHTGDPVFTGTLESTLKLALEGASFISAYDRTKMRDLGLPPISTLDTSKAQEIAASQGLNVVIAGSVDSGSSGYQLSVRAVQAVTGKVLTDSASTASDKDQVLFAVMKLGTALRKGLGDATSDSARRLSMETLSAASLEAVHEYAAGLDATSTGKNEEAIEHLMQAVDLDPNFGMAYTSLASALGNAGRRQDADKYIQEALRHIDHMTERERWRTRGNFYRLRGDDQKCVEEYSGLLEKYPSDTGAYNNMAFCLTDLRMLKKAVGMERRAVEILPKRAFYRASLAGYLAFAGDFQQAAKEAAELVKLNYDIAFVTQAYASLGLEQAAEAAEAYAKLAKANPSLGATALADLAAYEGRFQDAVSLLEKGADDDLSGRRPAPDAAADKFSALAYVQLLRGQRGLALDAAKRALELNQEVRTRFLIARIYAAFGESAKARELTASLSDRIELEPQAYGKLIEGEIALTSGDGEGAVKLFMDGNRLLDTWIGRFDLGRAYLVTGAFAQADSEFDVCLRRKGEALSLFLDATPTFAYFPLLYYYRGEAREGMKSADFAESYKKYLSIRGKAGEDPLLAEARRRAG